MAAAASIAWEVDASFSPQHVSHSSHIHRNFTKVTQSTDSASTSMLLYCNYTSDYSDVWDKITTSWDSLKPFRAASYSTLSEASRRGLYIQTASGQSLSDWISCGNDVLNTQQWGVCDPCHRPVSDTNTQISNTVPLVCPLTKVLLRWMCVTHSLHTIASDLKSN